MLYPIYIFFFWISALIMPDNSEVPLVIFILTVRIGLRKEKFVADLLQMLCKNNYSYPNSPCLASSLVAFRQS